MLKRFFARLFGRRAQTSGPPAAVTLPPPPAAPNSPLASPPPPPPPPPTPSVPEAAPVLTEAAPPEGHVRLILSDGTIVEPPVDADFEDRLRYLSENVLKRRNRPST